MVMNWEATGAIGETIGALAVFLTLIYLAMQIRQNTNTVQASAVDASVSRVTSVRQSIFENAEVAQIHVKGLADADDLNEESRTRFRLIMHNVLLSVSTIKVSASSENEAPENG
jgi:hypothetical protein